MFSGCPEEGIFRSSGWHQWSWLWVNTGPLSMVSTEWCHQSSPGIKQQQQQLSFASAQDSFCRRIIHRHLFFFTHTGAVLRRLKKKSKSWTAHNRLFLDFLILIHFYVLGIYSFWYIYLSSFILLFSSLHGFPSVRVWSSVAQKITCITQKVCQRCGGQSGRAAVSAARAQWSQLSEPS